MPGRPRKPTKLHVLHGTGEPARMAKRGSEPIVTAGLGEAPAYLSDIARQKWAEIALEPGYGEILTAADREAMAHFCLLYSRFVDDATGVKDMSASERQTFHSLAMQLGRTPAARSKVSAPAPKKQENQWDEIDRLARAK